MYIYFVGFFYIYVLVTILHMPLFLFYITNGDRVASCTVPRIQGTVKHKGNKVLKAESFELFPEVSLSPTLLG